MSHTYQIVSTITLPAPLRDTEVSMIKYQVEQSNHVVRVVDDRALHVVRARLVSVDEVTPEFSGRHGA